MVDPLLLEKVLDEMTSRGAEYAEARYHSVIATSIVVLNGVVVSAGREAREGVAFRAIAGGGLGFASTTRTSFGDLVVTADRAVAAARTSARILRNPIRMGPARLGRARYSVVEQKPLNDIPLDYKVKSLIEDYKALQLEKNGFKISSLLIHYTESVEVKILVTSDGARVESRTPRVMVFYNIAGESSGRRANRFFELGGSGGYEVYQGLSLAQSIQDDVESLYTALVKAKSPPKGVMDVVLAPEIVGLAVHESAGHPSEADRVLGREAAQAGMSFRSFYRDERIGSEHVTVVDDPTIPGSLGFYLYDDEGVAARERVLYSNGRIAELLHNRETAAVYETESNAAARAMDYESEPIVRMANTYMKPGSYRFEELVEDVRHGVYIRKYMEWNIDDVRWGQRYVGLEAYVIENGELKHPVTNVVLETTTKNFYSSIDAVGKDLKFYAGLCGKGEPAQAVPVWFGGPHVRLRSVYVGW